jgi:hypothetical protein
MAKEKLKQEKSKVDLTALKHSIKEKEKAVRENQIVTKNETE